MTSFLAIPIETQPEQIEQALYDELADAFPGWEPTEGDLLVWVAKWFASFAAEVSELVADVSGDVFQRWGEQILGVPALLAEPATTTATFTMADSAGYTVPAGSQLEVAITGDEATGFLTVEDLVVAPGSTSGSVGLEAAVAGAAANGAEGSATMIDALAFVATVVLDAPAVGGVDAETDDDYRDRLIGEAGLMARIAVLPADVETIAQRIPAVGRALALDGYDPTDESFGNERMVSVAVTDELGEPLDAGTKAELEALLEANREVNFVFYVIDPTYTDVDVTVAAVAYPGQDAAALEAAIEQAITDYLSPATWGTGPGLQPLGAWDNAPVVRRNDLIALVDGVPGVDYVASLTAPAADVTLDTPAPLPRAGTIAATVT